jgi:hypothetical protein
MAAPPSTLPPLARAHLALADDPDLAADQHSLPRTVAAMAAAIVLAFATPLAWASAVRGEHHDAPAATVVKAGHAVEDDGGEGDGA